MNSSVLKTIFIITICSLSVFAEIHPKYYRTDQDNAPEYVFIKALSVQSGINPFLRVKPVIVIAAVSDVIRTVNRLSVGDTIQVKYNHFSPGKGWVGPKPIPVLKKGNEYPAFLKFDKKENCYIPAARGASFEPLINY